MVGEIGTTGWVLISLVVIVVFGGVGALILAEMESEL